MESNTDQNDLMVRYLLGELHEEERRTIEERFFSDSDFFDELQSVEESMFQDYLNGRLPPERVEQVITHLLGSRFQMKELEYSRDVIETARRLPVRRLTDRGDKEEQPAAYAGRIREGSRRSPVTVFAVFAAASAIIAIFLAVYVAYELSVLRGQYADLASQTGEILQSLPPPSLILKPGSGYRTEGERTPAIILKKWMPAFVVKLKLRAALTPESVIIERVGQQNGEPPVWSSQVHASMIDDNTLELTVPAGDFVPGEYLISLKSVDATSRNSVTLYLFRVER